MAKQVYMYIIPLIMALVTVLNPFLESKYSKRSKKTYYVLMQLQWE